jgi:signal transduction histidine kinase
LLSTAVGCILDNALKYSPSRGEVNIVVSGCLQNGRKLIAIEIEDNGPGIKHTNLATLFEWFKQGEEPLTRVYGGIGIGLPLAKKALTLLRGEIEFSSELRKGCRCMIKLPVHTGHRT